MGKNKGERMNRQEFVQSIELLYTHYEKELPDDVENWYQKHQNIEADDFEMAVRRFIDTNEKFTPALFDRFMKTEVKKMSRKFYRADIDEAISCFGLEHMFIYAPERLNESKVFRKQIKQFIKKNKLIYKTPILDYSTMKEFSEKEATKILNMKLSFQIGWRDYCDKMEELTGVNYDPERAYYAALEFKSSNHKKPSISTSVIKSAITKLVDPF